MVKKGNAWTWIPTLYFAEGLPNVLVTSVAITMYMQLGLTDTEIGLYTGWLALPWVIKPFWSPFVDLFRTKRWWVLAMQMLLGASLAGIAFTLNTALWFQMSMFFLFLVAFSSATHDIAADGYYMIALDESQQAWFVGLRNTFYRIAMVFGEGVLVALAGALQSIMRDKMAFTWSLVFFLCAAIFIGIGLYHTRMMPRNDDDISHDSSVSEVWVGLKGTIRTFFTKFPLRPTVIAVLFLFLYRLPEALLLKMSPTFLQRPNSEGGLGLSPQEFGFAKGTLGIIGMLIGGIVGGMLASRDGLKRWMWPMVLAITLPDLVYVFLSMTMCDNLAVVSVCVFIEQLGYGFGFTVLTLFMLYYSQGAFRTSHYSLCTGISYLGLMLPGLVSGYLKDAVGYQSFFVIVCCCCAITFIITAFLNIDPEFGKKKEE